MNRFSFGPVRPLDYVAEGGSFVLYAEHEIEVERLEEKNRRLTEAISKIPTEIM